MPHCDGGLFQGYSKEPTKYKDKQLFFSGNSIIKAILSEISDKIKGNNNIEMILAGSQSGAIGAMIWASYFKDFFNTQNFKLILDSIPQSNPSVSGSLYETSLQNMMRLANIDGQHPFAMCYLRNLGREEQCFYLDQGYIFFNFQMMVL